MINTLEELLQDYASYSITEGLIDENTSMHLAENAQNYIKEMKKENLLNISGVSISFERNKLAKDILIALLQNPERYKYIANKVDNGEINQKEANLKNINKAFKIADSFLERI